MSEGNRLRACALGIAAWAAVFGSACSAPARYDTDPTRIGEHVRGPAGVRELVRAESALVSLTNRERLRSGLYPLLEVDPVLTAAALRHSREMKALGYFSHDSPSEESREPMQRYLNALAASGGRKPASFGIGENLYFKESRVLLDDEAVAREAQAGFMRSPAHRRNLLRGQWRRIGTAVVRGRNRWGNHVWLVTVLFRS
jgi:uncharacterized protein YkwD